MSLRIWRGEHGGVAPGEALSDRPATIDCIRLSGHESRVVGGEERNESCNLVRVREASHGLPRLELTTGFGVVARRLQSLLERGGIDGAWADGVAPDASRDEIRRD
jgi:hypothetical protein